jgi:hypothetical protein
MSTRSVPGLAVLVFTLPLFSAGCATSQAVTEVTQLTSVEPEARILLMTPDIKMYTLTVGGVPELNPDATELARANFVAERHRRPLGDQHLRGSRPAWRSRPAASSASPRWWSSRPAGSSG